MAIIKCKMCGGDLELIPDSTVAECEYCGSRQTVPTADNEKKLNLFARANRLRAACEFDKASGIYESIVADFPEEAEAYWGLVLCKYGIEYVDDPGTGKKIPTCHRSSFDSVMDDSNFEQAMENADGAARRVYREEAKQIEELRKGIIAVSANEEPYDIFICYKETAENGDRTLDSVLAQDIYDALTAKGYRTFFARITLEDKLGQEYEPYIFAALNSAKIMLAIGTDYEYFNAVWVKNEWSRYLKLMATDKSKHLIPCYKGIDAYDMPKEFAKLQAQDLGKVGATQDLLRGVEKILPKAAPAAPAAPVMVISGVDVNALVKRGWMALEDGSWEEAKKAFDQVLDTDPENCRARLGLYLGGMQTPDMETAERNYETLFYNTRANPEVQRIRKLADAELTGWFQKLDAKTEQIQKERAEKERQEREQKLAKLKTIRLQQKKVHGFISAGWSHTVGLKSDGTVVAVGYNKYGQCDVSGWSDIVAISAGDWHTVGLKSDGTVVAVGDNDYGRCNVSDWTDIVAISAGDWHTVGLKSDGTVVAVGYNTYGPCNVSGWSDIVAISAGDKHTVGLKSDGTVVAVGYNYDGQCDVGDWTDIVAISAGGSHTVGLKSDGTVVAVGDNKYGQHNVSGWSDIVAISAGSAHTVGLKSDGTVVATKYTADQIYYKGQCDVSGWSDIVAISAGGSHTVGLKSDGTVMAVGNKYYGQCDVSDWKLFQDYTNIEQERKEIAKRKAEEAARQAQQAAWRSEGKCQHCGGVLKGFFGKKCVDCGQPKDY